MKAKITLPKSAKIPFTLPKTIKFGETVYETSKKTTVRLNIAQELKIKPPDIYKYLKKLIGESVTQGEIIAEKKGLFFKKHLSSPVNGKVTEINHTTGTITIETQDLKDITSFNELKGKIIKKEKNTIIVELKDAISFTIKKTSFNTVAGGKLVSIEKTEEIDREKVEDKFVLIKKITPYLQNKLKALKTKAVITLYTPTENNLDFILINKIDDFESLLKNKREFALIDPATKILYIYN